MNFFVLLFFNAVKPKAQKGLYTVYPTPHTIDHLVHKNNDRTSPAGERS